MTREEQLRWRCVRRRGRWATHLVNHEKRLAAGYRQSLSLVFSQERLINLQQSREKNHRAIQSLTATSSPRLQSNGAQLQLSTLTVYSLIRSSARSKSMKILRITGSTTCSAKSTIKRVIRCRKEAACQQTPSTDLLLTVQGPHQS